MKLTEPGPQLSVQDIELFEGELGFDLPLDYRAFLITHNGGSPEESSFVYIPPFQKTLVHVFFGLGVGAEPAMAKWLSELRD